MLGGEDTTQDDLVVSKLLGKDITKYKSLFPRVSAAIQPSIEDKQPSKGDIVKYIYTDSQHKNPLTKKLDPEDIYLTVKVYLLCLQPQLLGKHLTGISKQIMLKPVTANMDVLVTLVVFLRMAAATPCCSIISDLEFMAILDLMVLTL
jgi:hypothetical protein